MRMSGTGVDLELGRHLATQPGLGKHARDALPDRFGRLICESGGVGGGTDAAGETGMAVDLLALGLARGQDHLVGVDDHDVIATIEVRAERRLVLAPQETSHLGGQATEHHALGVDDMPPPLDL